MSEPVLNRKPPRVITAKVVTEYHDAMIEAYHTWRSEEGDGRLNRAAFTQAGLQYCRIFDACERNRRV